MTARERLMGIGFIVTLIGGLAIVGTMEARDAAYAHAVAECEASAVACYVLKDENGYAYATTEAP